MRGLGSVRRLMIAAVAAVCLALVIRSPLPLLYLNRGSLLLARAALSEGRAVPPTSDAIAFWFQASLERDAADWRPYAGLARLADLDGHRSTSIEYWRETVDRSPYRRLQAFWLGSTLEKSGNHSQALSAWREAQAQRAFTLQGDAWRRTAGATGAESALRSYELALEIDPHWEPAARGLQEVLPSVIDHYWRRGDYGSAIPLLEKKAALSPAPTDFVRLGDYNQEAGLHQRASYWYEEGLQLFPRDAALTQRLGQHLLLQGELVQAENHLRRAISLDPSNPQAYRLLGQLLLQWENWEEAQDPWRKLALLKPDDVWARVRLGDISARLGRVAQARAYYRQALSLSPGLPHALEQLEELEAD
jgi:Flp pilus assembly protein TadD